jgi:hypothetical protein
MTVLHHTTQRRLKKIPQTNSVWEGDRRPLSGLGANLEPEVEATGECIIWVDGSEGVVRAMDVVSPQMGPEAIVRTLLRAIEHPHSPARPVRPQKVIVRDREIQFFLRGALQNLDIAIDYVPNLPLIDELFRGFEEIGNSRPPTIPPQYEPLLRQTAEQLWDDAPWELLSDSDILAIEINQCDVTTVYACVMGMLGKEYGVVLYRSLDSLKRFRSAALAEESVDRLEKEFLSQDCWFLTFEPIESFEADEGDDEDDDDIDISFLPFDRIRPLFGSVHPYEGMRPFLDEEEAMVVYIALQGIKRFCDRWQDELAEETIAALSDNYQISIPQGARQGDRAPAPLSAIAPEEGEKQSLSIKVSTMPELSSELGEMLEELELEDDEDSDEDEFPLRDDLVPENSFVKLDILPWNSVETIKEDSKSYYQSADIVRVGEGMPVILIQTSRPKGKVLIERIRQEGGLKGICFNPGEDSFTGMTYDLGILQTGEDDFYIFAEFVQKESKHSKALKKWNQLCQKTKGYCGLLIAMGVTGSSRGKPQQGDLMALFETKVLSTEELGMGVLQLMPEFELDWD